MNRTGWCAVAIGAVLSFGACAGSDDDDGEGAEKVDVDCKEGEIPTYDQVSAIDKCIMCHDSSKKGDQRNGAPTADNFDTYAGATRHPEELAGEVSAGKMPPPDSGVKITEKERQTLYKWALCGAPE